MSLTGLTSEAVAWSWQVPGLQAFDLSGWKFWSAKCRSLIPVKKVAKDSHSRKQTKQWKQNTGQHQQSDKQTTSSNNWSGMYRSEADHEEACWTSMSWIGAPLGRAKALLGNAACFGVILTGSDGIWLDVAQRARGRETSTPIHPNASKPPPQANPSTYKRFDFGVEVQWEQRISAIVLALFGRKQYCQGRCARLEVRMFCIFSQ